MSPVPQLSKRLPKILRRTPEPTVGELLGAGHEPPLSEAQQHGAGVLAALAQRDIDAANAAYDARQRAATEQRVQEDRAWTERQKRVPNVRPLGRGSA